MEKTIWNYREGSGNLRSQGRLKWRLNSLKKNTILGWDYKRNRVPGKVEQHVCMYKFGSHWQF